jgi:hypothetical protein
MRSVLVIITNVIIDKAFQMTLINNDDMVYKIPAATPAAPFGCRVTLK